MSELFHIKANSHFGVFVDKRVNCQERSIMNCTETNPDIGYPHKVFNPDICQNVRIHPLQFDIGVSVPVSSLIPYHSS
jgi:hypothetical protein